MDGASIRLQHYAAPCGTLLLGDYKGHVCLCDWDNQTARVAVRARLVSALGASFVEAPTPLLSELSSQLDEYFRCERRQFALPLLPVGTDFQLSVWHWLSAVPYGTTRPYRWLAHCLGRPQAVRAVAGACRANLISILLPCHRIVGADRSLTGYAGGIPAKRFLLNLEQSALF